MRARYDLSDDINHILGAGLAGRGGPAYSVRGVAQWYDRLRLVSIARNFATMRFVVVPTLNKLCRLGEHVGGQAHTTDRKYTLKRNGAWEIMSP